MRNRIEDALKTNESEVKKIDKKLQKTMAELQGYLSSRVLENNVSAIIRCLPAYLKRLERDYNKLVALDEEIWKFRYFLNVE